MRPQDLHLLPVFAAVARHGSMTGAARELRLTKSVVSRHVRSLEERFGARLFDRTTRRIRVTRIGEQVLAAATAAVDAANEIDRLAAVHNREPSGTLRVTAPLALGPLLVAPVAAEIARLHPSTQIVIDLDDRRRDLVAEGFDVALRMSPLRDSTQIVSVLGWDDEVIVAAPEVVKAYGASVEPRALHGAPWIVHSSVNVGNTVMFYSAVGEKEEVPVAHRALASTAESVAALARGGVGFAVVPRHLAAADLAAGQLELACAGWRARRLPLHVLLPGRRNPPLVKLFLNRLAAAVLRLGFQKKPIRNG